MGAPWLCSVLNTGFRSRGYCLDLFCPWTGWQKAWNLMSLVVISTPSDKKDIKLEFSLGFQDDLPKYLHLHALCLRSKHKDSLCSLNISNTWTWGLFQGALKLLSLISHIADIPDKLPLLLGLLSSLLSHVLSCASFSLKASRSSDSGSGTWSERHCHSQFQDPQGNVCRETDL